MQLGGDINEILEYGIPKFPWMFCWDRALEIIT